MLLANYFILLVNVGSCLGFGNHVAFRVLPAMDDKMCPAGEVDFKTATNNVMACARLCSETSSCRSFIYVGSNRICFGIRSEFPFSSYSPLTGAVFYHPRTASSKTTTEAATTATVSTTTTEEVTSTTATVATPATTAVATETTKAVTASTTTTAATSTTITPATTTAEAVTTTITETEATTTLAATTTTTKPTTTTTATTAVAGTAPTTLTATSPTATTSTDTTTPTTSNPTPTWTSTLPIPTTTITSQTTTTPPVTAITPSVTTTTIPVSTTTTPPTTTTTPPTTTTPLPVTTTSPSTTVTTTPTTTTMTLPACTMSSRFLLDPLEPEQFSCSSEESIDFSPEKGRVLWNACWSADYTLTTDQWIQADVGVQRWVTEVETQGNPAADEWVTSYTLSYSIDCSVFQTVLDENGQTRVFSGNSDRHTIVVHVINPPIEGTCYRLSPISFFGRISLRFDLSYCIDF